VALEHRQKAFGIDRVAGFDDDIEDQSGADVTARMKAEAEKLDNPEKLWLLRLIKTFKDERALWQTCRVGWLSSRMDAS
jgi:hypothetical protein